MVNPTILDTDSSILDTVVLIPMHNFRILWNLLGQMAKIVGFARPKGGGHSKICNSVVDCFNLCIPV